MFNNIINTINNIYNTCFDYWYGLKDNAAFKTILIGFVLFILIYNIVLLIKTLSNYELIKSYIRLAKSLIRDKERIMEELNNWIINYKTEMEMNE